MTPQAETTRTDDTLRRVHHLTIPRVPIGATATAFCGYRGTARPPDEALQLPCCPMCREAWQARA